MNKDRSPIYRNQIEVNSIESLNMYVNGMDTRHIQVGKGSLNTSVLEAQIGGGFINSCYFDNEVLSEGALPKDMISIGYLQQAQKPNIFLGKEAYAGDFVVVGQGLHAMHSISSGSHFSVLQLHQKDLAMLGVEVEKNHNALYRKMGNQHNQYFTEQISTVLRGIQTSDEATIQHIDANMVYNHILAETAYLLNLTEKPIPVDRHEYAKVARIISDYLWAYSSDIIQVADLCRITGKSERSLERICNYTFGKAPRQLIKLHRLNSFRKRLKNIPQEQKLNLTVLIMEYGFTNAGRFAGEYRKLFGEFPSQTLRG